MNKESNLNYTIPFGKFEIQTDMFSSVCELFSKADFKITKNNAIHLACVIATRSQIF